MIKTNGAFLSFSLIAKLGSIAVHAQEIREAGHAFDLIALRTLLDDPDVKNFMVKYKALLPVKRQTNG